jgi:hypothetical protein
VPEPDVMPLSRAVANRLLERKVLLAAKLADCAARMWTASQAFSTGFSGLRGAMCA